jgi:hypothetical protein
MREGLMSANSLGSWVVGNCLSLHPESFMEIRFTDASGFDLHANGADLAVIVFTRAEIEACRVGSAVERLLLLSDDADHVRRFAGRVVLMFDGYDGDPRALPQIRECVRFFRSVDSQWSYWLHFLLPDPEVLRLAVLLTVDVQVRARGRAQAGYALRDPAQLAEVLDRWFTAMNALHDAHGVDVAFNEAQTNALMRAIAGWA